MRALSLFACQIAIPDIRCVSERDAHVADICARVGDELNGRAVDLIVLPELSTIDYSREAFEQLDQLAETETGSSAQAFAELAERTGAAVLFGYPRRTHGGYRISQQLVRPGGSEGAVFDKIHMAQFGASMEKEFFGRGQRLCVFEVAGYRIAPMICYDIRIPEMARALAVEHRVDLITHCGAYYRDESFASWHAFVQTRAMENQLYMLSLNRAGQHFGASLFCPPWTDEDVPMERFPQHEEAFKLLEVSHVTIAQVRRDYSFLADRLERYE